MDLKFMDLNLMVATMVISEPLAVAIVTISMTDMDTATG